jgi:tetratricopeptide (TPR) repeat protein
MLETIRAYGLERLAETGDEADWRERHCVYFLDFTESHDPEHGPEGRDLAVVFAHVDMEIDNLRAALEWARDSGEHERLLRLTASLGHYWSVRGLVHEKHSWNTLALARGSSPARARMAILNWESAYYARQRDWESAAARVAEWLRTAEQEGDAHEALRAQNASALQATDKGDLEAARRKFEEVGARAAELGDRVIVAFVAVNLSGLFSQEGDYASGIEYGARAVELFRELGDESGQAVAIANSAWCSLALADPAQAASDFHTSLSTLVRYGAFRTGQAAGTLEGLGAAFVSLRLMEAGVRTFGGAEALREEMGFHSRDPLEDELRDAAIATARAGLGEEAFSAAWKEGEATSPEDAMAFALQVPLPAPVDPAQTLP